MCIYIYLYIYILKSLAAGNSQASQVGVCWESLFLLFKEVQGYTSLNRPLKSYWCLKDSR